MICAIFTMSANQSIPFYSVGKRWTKCRIYPLSNNKRVYNTYEVLSSENIDGREVFTIADVHMIGKFEDYYSYCYGYEDEGKVYSTAFGGDLYRYFQIFDFDVEVGELLQLNFVDGDLMDSYFEVVSVYDEPIMGKSRKVIKLKVEDPYTYTFKWIEGVGCIYPDVDTLHAVFCPADGSWEILWECWDNDECIFSYTDYFGNDSVPDIIEPENTSDSTIYNLQGMPVSSLVFGNIYIVNGKKMKI